MQSITFLELLQLHHGCGLPKPVQLHISFETNRFITRFNAISSELKVQSERRKIAAVRADDTNEAVEVGEAGDEISQCQDGVPEVDKDQEDDDQEEYQEDTNSEYAEGVEGERDQEAERARRRDEENLAKQKRDHDRVTVGELSRLL